MRILTSVLLLFLFSNPIFAKRITLQAITIEIPDAAAKGVKTTKTVGGISSYAFSRDYDDSSSYNYNYSFRYANALFEFRETTRPDIWEWLESSYDPKLARKKEFKHYKVDDFREIENPFIKGKLENFQVLYEDGRRKLTLIYKFNQTHELMASVKCGESPAVFMAAQDSLISMLKSVEIYANRIPDYIPVSEDGNYQTIDGHRAEHYLIDLPFSLSNDFNNPVVQIGPNDQIIAAYAHAQGSEFLFIDKNMKLVEHTHFDKVIHDFYVTNNAIFSASSNDYNLLRYDIYPSLYLTRHDLHGNVLSTQSFFKKDNVKFPGNQVFDYYSRDNVCLELVDSVGLIYCNSEKRWGLNNVAQGGAYRTFSTKSGFLKKGEENLWHVSHCFGQKSTRDKDHVYLFSVGDQYPRSVVLSKVNLTVHKDSTDTTSFWIEKMLGIPGIEGDNYVYDTHLSDPIIIEDRIYIGLETEVDAKTKKENNYYSRNRGMNDVFLMHCKLDGTDVEIKRLTNTRTKEEVNPKIAQIGDKILFMFTEVKYGSSGPESFTDKFVFLNYNGSRTENIETFNSLYQNELPEYNLMPDSPINRDGNEFVTMSDGSIIWLRLMKNTRQLEVIRIYPQE